MLSQECFRIPARTISLLRSQRTARTQKERLNFMVCSRLKLGILMQKLMHPCRSSVFSLFHPKSELDQSGLIDMYLQKQTCYISLLQKRNGLVYLWV